MKYFRRPFSLLTLCINDEYLSLAALERLPSAPHSLIFKTLILHSLERNEVIEGRLYNNEYLAECLRNVCEAQNIKLTTKVVIAFEGKEIQERIKRQPDEISNGEVQEKLMKLSSKVQYAYNVDPSLIMQYRLWAHRIPLQLTVLTTLNCALFTAIPLRETEQADEVFLALTKERCNNFMPEFSISDALLKNIPIEIPAWLMTAHYGLFLLGEKHGRN